MLANFPPLRWRNDKGTAHGGDDYEWLLYAACRGDLYIVLTGYVDNVYNSC